MFDVSPKLTDEFPNVIELFCNWLFCINPTKLDDLYPVEFVKSLFIFWATNTPVEGLKVIFGFVKIEIWFPSETQKFNW